MEDSGEESYEGIPLEEIQIDAIDWTHRGDHIRTRSQRIANEFDVEPSWATEAGLDPLRVVRTTGGKSLKVIGKSASAPPRDENEVGRILKLWIVPKNLEAGEWWGASACDANRRDRDKYREVEPR